MYQSLDDFRQKLADLPNPNATWRQSARRRQTELTKPPGSLGRLEDCAIFLAGWGEKPEPAAEHAKVVVFAGNHGVTAQNVSPYPSEVTAQMVQNFMAGGAAINAMTDLQGISLDVVPLELDRPTKDISGEPAMQDRECLDALNTGASAVQGAGPLDILIVGEMGIGNTTIAAALAASTFGGNGKDWAGPGTGLAAAGVSHKARIVDQALRRHRTAMNAAERLRCLGGRETAAIAGAIVAARHARTPVLLDGYVVTASVSPLFAENPAIVDHCLAGHVSAEPAHGRLLEKMGLKPLLDLGMRLGEGTGAALALSVLRASAATHNNMATFAEAAVFGRAAEAS